MNPASLLFHIDAKPGISSKLLMGVMLLGGFSASAQTSPADVASRMEASARRQVISVARMNQASASMSKASIEASIDRQKRSVAKQPRTDSSGGFFVLPPPTAGRPDSAEPQCAALPSTEIDELVTQAGEASSVSPDLLRSVMKQESGFRPCAVSGKGAMGLMQLMGPTADELGVKNAFDPRENANAGAKFLRQLIDLYSGDLSLALSAYNAGPGRVDAAFGVPRIPETMNYVNRILSGVPGSEATRQSGTTVESAGDEMLRDAGR